jgi:mannose-6-phosphate isomerase
VPITGEGAVDGVAWKAGECLTLEGRCEIAASAGSDLLLAYPGDKRL